MQEVLALQQLEEEVVVEERRFWTFYLSTLSNNCKNFNWQKALQLNNFISNLLKCIYNFNRFDNKKEREWEKG